MSKCETTFSPDARETIDAGYMNADSLWQDEADGEVRFNAGADFDEREYHSLRAFLSGAPGPQEAPEDTEDFSLDWTGEGSYEDYGALHASNLLDSRTCFSTRL